MIHIVIVKTLFRVVGERSKYVLNVKYVFAFPLKKYFQLTYITWIHLFQTRGYFIKAKTIK